MPTPARNTPGWKIPTSIAPGHCAFTPDGTKLVCATGDGYCVHIWDLQAIRRELDGDGAELVNAALTRAKARGCQETGAACGLAFAAIAR